MLAALPAAAPAMALATARAIVHAARAPHAPAGVVPLDVQPKETTAATAVANINRRAAPKDAQKDVPTVVLPSAQALA